MKSVVAEGDKEVSTRKGGKTNSITEALHTAVNSVQDKKVEREWIGLD